MPSLSLRILNISVTTRVVTSPSPYQVKILLSRQDITHFNIVISSDLPSHMARCGHRNVKCPGLDCSVRLPLSKLHNHVITCCVERAEIKPYKLPHKFTYMMNEDIKDLGGENQNFNWKLEGMKFEDRIFFLKVTRKARAGRWFFFVQMVGSLEDTVGYGVTIIVFRPEDGPEGKYSQR